LLHLPLSQGFQLKAPLINSPLPSFGVTSSSPEWDECRLAPSFSLFLFYGIAVCGEGVSTRILLPEPSF